MPLLVPWNKPGTTENLHHSPLWLFSLHPSDNSPVKLLPGSSGETIVIQDGPSSWGTEAGQLALKMALSQIPTPVHSQ